MSEVVTGDAVVLDVQIAQLPVRAVSALIDITVMFFAYLLGLMLWAATPEVARPIRQSPKLESSAKPQPR